MIFAIKKWKSGILISSLYIQAYFRVIGCRREKETEGHSDAVKGSVQQDAYRAEKSLEFVRSLRCIRLEDGPLKNKGSIHLS